LCDHHRLRFSTLVNLTLPEDISGMSNADDNDRADWQSSAASTPQGDPTNSRIITATEPNVSDQTVISK
jgi:hypothetical protein